VPLNDGEYGKRCKADTYISMMIQLTDEIRGKRPSN